MRTLAETAHKRAEEAEGTAIKESRACPCWDDDFPIVTMPAALRLRSEGRPGGQGRSCQGGGGRRARPAGGPLAVRPRGCPPAALPPLKVRPRLRLRLLRRPALAGARPRLRQLLPRTERRPLPRLAAPFPPCAMPRSPNAERVDKHIIGKLLVTYFTKGRKPDVLDLMVRLFLRSAERPSRSRSLMRRGVAGGSLRPSARPPVRVSVRQARFLGLDETDRNALGLAAVGKRGVLRRALGVPVRILGAVASGVAGAPASEPHPVDLT